MDTTRSQEILNLQIDNQQNKHNIHTMTYEIATINTKVENLIVEVKGKFVAINGRFDSIQSTLHQLMNRT
jgi:phage-related protein